MAITYVTINDPTDSYPWLREAQATLAPRCSCGTRHESLVLVDSAASNRERVAQKTYTSEYPEANSSDDAWQFRTLNLDHQTQNLEVL